jgi:hypothetical protein
MTDYGQHGGFRFQAAEENFLALPSGPKLGPSQSPDQWLPTAVSLETKRLDAWSWLLTYILCLDKNTWSYTFTPPYFFMGPWFVKYSDNLWRRNLQVLRRILKKLFMQMWNGFIWLRTEIGGLFVNTIMKSGFQERREISWPSEWR